MCGIAGFIKHRSDSNVAENRQLLASMCEIIKHRGPDEEGAAGIGRAYLGMRRLSIIDLAGGQQPIFNETNDLAIVFNGEIYNYREMSAELQGLGHSFRTRSDTECIVHAYEEFGTNCVQRLRGMFAFAIWNSEKEQLFLARDRVGKKPLFYCLTGSGDFVFGSELKSLLLHPSVQPTIDRAALDAYLTFGYVPEELCIFKSIRKLPPGHILTFENGHIETKRYWNFEFAYEPLDLEREAVENRLFELIEDAVKVRLISEVPLGAFLSGGIDSSTVVGIMSRLLSQPVKTFSIGFREDSFDELKFARLAAKHFKTDHHEFVVTPDLVDEIDKVVWHFDEPFSDPSSLPTFLLSRLAREHVTVVLSGDGGDELFGGYTRYRTQLERSRISLLSRSGFAGPIRKAIGALPHSAYGRNYLHNLTLEPTERYVDSISQFNEMNRGELYSADFRASLNGSDGLAYGMFAAYANEIDDTRPADQLFYLDCKTYLPGDILTKVDRMTMANSLEARTPLLDQNLVDFAVRIPAQLKISPTGQKEVLKSAMRGIVPDEILYRKKQGFGVPIVEWINNELKDRIRETLTERRAIERGYFRKQFVETLLNEHRSGRRDHAYPLWALFVLELWHREFVDA